MNEKDLFKSMIIQYMMNKSDRFENDRLEVCNRVSLHHLNVDDYYALLVTEVQESTARVIFRDINEIIKTYL